MDTITVSLQLTFDQPLDRADYLEFIDSLQLLIEKEVGPGGELELSDNSVCDFEIEHEQLDN